ncbi:MAG TPA: SDR family NAD(P)-dependent oxidoreductase, partial [Actinomycetes bacterium]|nr:SDR family NAD(P)-dependent oxidoreductase [Actinomycetes bacterium]
MPQRAVIVAGATSGIGLAIAEMAVPRGYHVILVGRDQDALAQAVERVRGRGGSCEGVACDLTVPEQVKRVVSEVRQRDLAAWIHCAGQMTYGEVIDTPWATFREVLDTNVGSVFLA